MGNAARALGLIFLVYSVAAFLVNFGFWSPWGLGQITVIWNPIGAFISGQLTNPVGEIPLIGTVGDWLLVALNYFIAGIYSFVLFIMGFFMVIK